MRRPRGKFLCILTNCSHSSFVVGNSSICTNLTLREGQNLCNLTTPGTFYNFWKIDFVNISLNASCVEKYQPISRSQYGEAGFAGMIDFAKLCRKEGVDCRFSIVDCIGEEEVEACKRLAESAHVPLYIRSYITDS